LKQLDLYYNHPKYKQDFFIVYTNEKWKETKIIFEYDDLNSAIANWDSDLYVSENDIYMEKVLESYWYKFIRLNEFNLWSNKVDTLNQKMKMLIWEKVEKKTVDDVEIQDTVKDDWAILEDMQLIMKWLENWTFKICDKCGEVKEIEKFKDDTLKSWYWRQCIDCKSSKRWNMRRRMVNSEGWNPRSCPICWSKMVLRYSRYWAFYWCSRYPRCLGIVSIKKGKYISF
jgi:ssDNA-binding Zn-finger/Zn-ribbon topoisomerase 1